tara:strand:+ start:1428 stop:2156 length:729 start_codon:yes stop_codon:yes gene_type:complete
MALNTEAWEHSLTVFNELYYTGEPQNLVGLTNYRGEFDTSLSYNKNDLVKDSLGNLFVCITGITGPSGATGIATDDTSKWDKVSFNDTTFRLRNTRIDGVAVSANNFPGGVQQQITIPAGLFGIGDVIVIEAWLTQVSGGGTGWAVFIDNQQLTASMGTNGNAPCRIKMVVVKYGNNGTGSPADLVGYLDHSNSGGTGLRRGTIASRNTNVDFSVSLVKVAGTSSWRCEYYQVQILKSTTSA